MQTPSAPRQRQQGQILVIFALALVAIVAMTGLVLDGGSTFVQKRDMQNVADAASLAGGYAYGNSTATDDTTKKAVATAAALSIAAANGYTNGTSGVVVDVALDAPGGAGRHITVTVGKPHENNFSGVVGMATWDVTTSATAIAGPPNAARGAMPVIFNQRAFTENGANPGNNQTYGEPDPGSDSVPLTASKFNWTLFCDDCNLPSSEAVGIIRSGGNPGAVNLDDTLDPVNAGSHTPLFSALASLIGEEFPVPIVDDDGNMLGWSLFHLSGSVGGSTKTISGWFVDPQNPPSMFIVDGASAAGFFGNYIVKLYN
jgi:Flp pilus assembly protein TadG